LVFEVDGAPMADAIFVTFEDCEAIGLRVLNWQLVCWKSRLHGLSWGSGQAGTTRDKAALGI
jgi:hypothetical protein